MASITSEPVYQPPDEGNIDITIEDQPIPIPGPQPVLPPIIETVDNPYLPKRLYDKIRTNTIIVNRLDYYANTIPLGAFCNAVAFIIYGFYRCKVYTVNETFLWAIILLFGGIGQCTAGFLEFIKARSFPTTLYIVYGFYCLSHYALYIIPRAFVKFGIYDMIYPIEPSSLCAFYSAWVAISFAILLAAAKVNSLYLCQCLATFAFFLLRAVGEGSNSLGTKRNAAGILEAIAGFFSLFVFISQMINNEAFHSPCFPTCPTTAFNEVDPILPARR